MLTRSPAVYIAITLGIIGCGTTVTLTSPLPADCEEGTVRTALGECEAPSSDDNGVSDPVDTEDTDDDFDTGFPTDSDGDWDTGDTGFSDLYPTAGSWWAEYGPDFCAAINTCASNAANQPPWYPVDCSDYVVDNVPPLLSCDYDPDDALNCMLDVAVNGFGCQGPFAQEPASCEDVCTEAVLVIP